MSWMQKLYETYESCAGKEPDGADRLMPIAHTTQQAQVEVVIDGTGTFRRATVLLDKDKTNTMIPCTEESAGRAGSKPVNHPLCDKLQYVAGDFLDFGGEVTSGFASRPEEPHKAFLESLTAWASSSHQHPKLDAIRRYVAQGRLVADLVTEQVLPVDAGGKLLKQWAGEKNTAPAIFKAIQNTQTPEEAFIRWRIEDGEIASGTWDDSKLVSSWVAYYQDIQTKRGYCMATGNEAPLAIQHPAKLRHGGDKAKLISSNDTSGFTFRGRFIDADQVATVSFDVTQKAHNALRWLVNRQAYRNGDQAVVSWAVSGKPLPDPFENTLELFGHSTGNAQASPTSFWTAQSFAVRLARAIAGYSSKLDPTDEIVVMALDSATPGRMSITFYRELKGSEFLERIQEWHRRYAWLQNFGKGARFIGSAAPRDIAEAAYGRRLDDKLRKSTVERLLPCIVEGRPVPRDLVLSTFQRAARRAGLDNWEWEKCLGIACGLFKGFHIERKYEMALEQDRKGRDYLYGRLLAIADNIEGYALSMAGEKRDTTAARLMQRFADRPASTWRNIEMALRPYMSRLRAGERSAGFLVLRERLLDEIVGSFQSADFTSDARLTGEFLLGYHCQRQAWRPAAGAAISEESAEISIEN
ncbi:MAG: type I-C CRISPR-associated protein Cas8c/Csd1 [Bryobacteraceae bacterium]